MCSYTYEFIQVPLQQSQRSFSIGTRCHTLLKLKMRFSLVVKISSKDTVNFLTLQWKTGKSNCITCNYHAHDQQPSGEFRKQSTHKMYIEPPDADIFSLKMASCCWTTSLIQTDGTLYSSERGVKAWRKAKAYSFDAPDTCMIWPSQTPHVHISDFNYYSNT